MGKNYDHSHALGFAIEAVELEIEDAGLNRSDIDGLLVNPGVTWSNAMASFALQQAMGMGMRDLRLTSTMNAGGATAGSMVMHAAQSIAAGMANAVACVFADAPLKPPQPQALVARRHMHLYGTTNDHMGAIAVAQRQWANMNPMAQFHNEPLTLDDYHNSRWVAEPFHLLDCCLVSNGGLCVIVTSVERARDLKKPPVCILGMGQGHPGGDPMDTLVSGAPLAKETAFRMAGVNLQDIDIVELYDCYTFTVLITLEEYGFCRKGEGGPFVEGGRVAPGSSLPVNTGGGQLSSFYMWGMTPICEGVIQVRGEGGGRQVPRHDVALVSGNGGILSTHSTLVLGANG
jgi:acetyl-CoA acetyltransferase